MIRWYNRNADGTATPAINDIPNRSADWQVAETIICHDDHGSMRVSTVFLGLDHRHFGDGPPVLWETLIFDGPLDGEMWRYTSEDAAKQGHEKAVAMVKHKIGRWSD